MKYIYIYECPNFEGACSKEDMDMINDNAIQLAAYWTKIRLKNYWTQKED